MSKKFTQEQKVEAMRDFCGSFGRGKTEYQKLVYLIPAATLKTYESFPEEYGITSECSALDSQRKALADGFDMLLCDPTSKAIVDRFMAGYSGDFVDHITEEEVAKVLDMYYVETVSARVELMADNMVKSI